MGLQYLLVSSSSSVVARLVVLIILAITATQFAPANAYTEVSTLNLSSWNHNATYYSSTEYFARGMKPFYNMTHIILKWFAGDKPIPDGYLVVTEQHIELGPNVESHSWGDLLKAYWGVLLVIVLTALLVVLMPIIGLCFCCCRCAGACGGRSQPFDKKHDTCRRAFLGFLLICTTTGILFGVVIAFVTNSYMQEGIIDSTDTVRKGGDDTKTFLDTTSKEINHLLVKNYGELTESLKLSVRESSNSVVEKLENKFNAGSFEYLGEFATKLPQIRNDLIRMKDITNELRVNASQLSDALRGVKRELLVTLTNCPHARCKEVLHDYNIGKLDANGIDYNQIPDVSETIENLGDLTKEDFTESISKSANKIKSMRNILEEKIDRSITNVNNAMNEAGRAGQTASNDIKKTFGNIAGLITNYTKKGADEADYYIENYSMYRFYIGIAISSVLLLVLVCLTVALFCGVCGKRPEGYGDDCCNKGAGARFLMLAITIMFLTISALAIAALSHFLVGLVLHRGVCIPLQDPENDQIFNYIDSYIDLNNVLYQNKKSLNIGSKQQKDQIVAGSMPPFRISQIIVECKKNQSIYEVLRLYNYIDINEVLHYTEDYRINETLRKLVTDIEHESNIKIFDERVEEKLTKLMNSDLKDFDKDRFVDNVNGSITDYSLKRIADELIKTGEIIGNSPEVKDIKNTLIVQALHLQTYEEKLVTPMNKQKDELIELAVKLQSSLQYKNESFSKSMKVLLGEMRKAQDFIDKERPAFIQESADELIEPFTNKLQTYFKFIVKSVRGDVGKCTPLAKVYDSLVVGACNKFVDPFNGFWAGVGWCVILFLPTLVISIKLSSLYQKSDPYPGPLVESEYLYDAYSERDNIPLANGPKNKRRKTKPRRRGSRDRRGDYYEDSGSLHGTPAGRDARYSDMAPRHWDGGPPRYQNPPMAPPASEYERPPPYYYPGAPSEPE